MSELSIDGVKKFTGRSSREVYAKIRAEFGDDAVIVEQRRDGGTVTVLASADFPEAAPPQESGWQIYQKRLLELGYTRDFVDGLAPASSWQDLKETVAGSILIAPPPIRLQGSYRFVGAPGVGKTTSIIKLIAEHVLHFGAAGCALISTDQRRLAGSEQLALAAELLGVQFQECHPDSLDQILLAHSDTELVLIDTAGTSFGQGVSRPAACPDIVVVPATWQARALQRTWLQLTPASVAGVVLTQVDQCESLAEVMSVLSEFKVPLRWLSSGPDLYDDLEPVNSKILIDLLFPEIDRSQNSTTFA